VATVRFPSGWTPLTGGVDEVVIDAARVVDLLDALRARFPSLSDHLDAAAVAIDGRVYHHARYEPLTSESEVYLLPPVGGGASG
jgi:molybdopterin converting factor small subunit